MKQNAPSYEDYAATRQQVAEVLESIACAFDRLDAGERAAQLRKSLSTLLNDTFKVLVVGEFKRGKSTFINAMLGQDLLPAKVAPCTAVITRVRWRDTKTAELHFIDGRPALTFDLERFPNSLKEHITIKLEGDEDAPEFKNPYSKAEVGYPLSLCRNNVEIVDSPGLNEHKARTEVTRQFMGEADAMVVVLSCEQQLNETERQFVERDLHDRELKDVFFVWNRYDAVRESPSDIADIKAVTRSRLEPLIGGRPRVFYISARDALLGRKERSAELIERSNIVKLEAALEAFLALERARVKLQSPLRGAENAVREGLLELIPYRENLFKQPLEEIREKLETERPRLDEAERQRERILRSIERRADSLAREAQAMLRTFMAELDGKLSASAEALPVSTLDTMFSPQKATNKLATALEDSLRDEIKSWKAGPVANLMKMHQDQLLEDLDDQGQSFIANLEAIKESFQPNVSIASSTELDAPSTASRWAGAIGGALLLDPGHMIEGATGGVGEVARGIAFRLTAGMGLAVLGFGVPVILPAVLGISAVRTIMRVKSAGTEIRRKAVQDVCSAVQAKIVDIEQNLEREIRDAFSRIRESVDQRMTILVDEVRGQVQAVIRDREQHESAAADALNVLAEVRKTLSAGSGSLAALRERLEAVA